MYDSKKTKKANDAQTDRAESRTADVGTARQGSLLGNGKKGLGKSEKSKEVSREIRNYKVGYGIKKMPDHAMLPSVAA